MLIMVTLNKPVMIGDNHVKFKFKTVLYFFTYLQNCKSKFLSYHLLHRDILIACLSFNFVEIRCTEIVLLIGLLGETSASFA